MIHRTRALQCAVVAALAIALAGCAEITQPTESVTYVPGPPPTPFVPTFPPLSQPGRIYTAADSLYGYVANSDGRSGLASRFVLYDSGSFALQFSSWSRPPLEYRGSYATVGSALTFTFDEKRWVATGTLRSDSLVVGYNADASLSDFADGMYVRSPGP